MIDAKLSKRCLQSLIKSHNYRDCTGVRHHSLFIAPRKGRGGGGREEREGGREGFLGDHIVTWFSGVNGRGISLSTPT